MQDAFADQACWEIDLMDRLEFDCKFPDSLLISISVLEGRFLPCRGDVGFEATPPSPYVRIPFLCMIIFFRYVICLPTLGIGAPLEKESFVVCLINILTIVK